MTAPLDFESWSCPLPLRDYPSIIMGHGGGGKLSSDLVEHLFLPAFRNEALEELGDASVVAGQAGSIALSTDSFVVRPLFFPGGSIGELAVNGTLNDLAMAGARPRYLTAGFILEEGLPLAQLAAIVDRMAEAARTASVAIVTGDTKVVERGHGDGCYINTAGVGFVPAGVSVGPRRARSGDAVLLSGPIGDHGIAVMSVREGLTFETEIRSDTAALYPLVERMLEQPEMVHVLRDPTRGGVCASLNELAQASGVGIVIEETCMPARAEVEAACDLLGLDPLSVANEGKLLAIVAPGAADEVLTRMRAHPLGREAVRIGKVTAENAGIVAVRTALGALRVLTPPVGELLPRIC